MAILGDDSEWDWVEVDDAGSESGELPRRTRNGNGASTIVSLRLEHAEYEALRAVAERRGIGVTVLARSFIRRGLAGSAR